MLPILLKKILGCLEITRDSEEWTVHEESLTKAACSELERAVLGLCPKGKLSSDQRNTQVC